MSELRSLIERFVTAGVDAVEAAEIVATAVIHGVLRAPKQRSAGAIRQERYRRNKASRLTESDACDGENISPKKSAPTPPKKNNPY